MLNFIAVRPHLCKWRSKTAQLDRRTSKEMSYSLHTAIAVNIIWV